MRRRLPHFFALLLLLGFASCTTTRVKKYGNILEPMLGVSKKTEVDRLLGSPSFCRPDGDRELCEYRTTAARNSVVPAMDRKLEGFGPDLSPYDQFDVLHLFYDDSNTLKGWEPFVILQE